MRLLTRDSLEIDFLARRLARASTYVRRNRRLSPLETLSLDRDREGAGSGRAGTTSAPSQRRRDARRRDAWRRVSASRDVTRTALDHVLRSLRSCILRDVRAARVMCLSIPVDRVA